MNQRGKKAPPVTSRGSAITGHPLRRQHEQSWQFLLPWPLCCGMSLPAEQGAPHPRTGSWECSQAHLPLQPSSTAVTPTLELPFEGSGVRFGRQLCSMGRAMAEFVPRTACPLPGSAPTAHKPCCFLAQVLEFTRSVFCQQLLGQN